MNGLNYIPDYLTVKTEELILGKVDSLAWSTELNRRVQHYGYKYAYKERKVTPEMYLGPLPKWLQMIAEKLHRDKVMFRVADQVIVNEYEPGQGIGRHVDCVPCFDDSIASISLGSTCVMEFQNVKTKEKNPLFLAQRSVVAISGEARYDWFHSIPKRLSDNGIARQRRVSLTFRNVVV